MNHLVKSYNPDEIRRDRFVGMVLEVEFPEAPEGGWKLDEIGAPGTPRGNVPSVRAILGIVKKAEGVDRILGQHHSRKVTWTVSQGNEFYVSDGGFMIANQGAGYSNEPWLRLAHKTTPPDVLRAVWLYLSWQDAPEELTGKPDKQGLWKGGLFDTDRSQIRGRWNGRDLVYLIGGLNGMFYYSGIALTPLGKEAAAGISRILASQPADPFSALRAGLDLAQLFSSKKK